MRMSSDVESKRSYLPVARRYFGTDTHPRSEAAPAVAPRQHRASRDPGR